MTAPGGVGPRRPAPDSDLAGPSGRGVRRLGPFLAWAVVFADLGTSVYYVPGILLAQVGPVAPAFVLLATVAFVLVTLEHLEVTHRFPRGGGGVAAAVQAFGPRVGVVSGSLMVSAYLLSIAITAVSALHYLSVLFTFPHSVPILAALAVLVLGGLNWVGVRDTARLALVAALAALTVDAVLIVAVIRKLGASEWRELLGNLGRIRGMGGFEAAGAFAAAWLAYSGLESLAQLAPAIRVPRRRVARLAAALVIVSILLTVPLFTALAVEAAQAGHIAPQGALLVPVARIYGGPALLAALVLTAALLLLVAANVAFIGCYNVFQAIGEYGYLPAAVAGRHPGTGVPRGAVVVITLAAAGLVLGTGGDLGELGALFAFGLLGSYTLTSLSVDVLRWRDGRRGGLFVLGLVATAALLVPWVTSWFAKWQATLYGATVSGVLLAVALVTRRGWIRAGRLGFIRAATAEEAASDRPEAQEILTLAQAVEVRASYPSGTLLALREANPALCAEAARRARGVGDTAVYVVCVDEVPGLIFPANTGPSDHARRVLETAAAELRRQDIDAVPVWRLAHDAGASIAEAAETLGARCVMVGTQQRSAVWHFLRGDVLKTLISHLPEACHVVICE